MFVTQRADRRPPADRQGNFARGGPLGEQWTRYLDWLEMCDWARATTEPSALFLTPERSQSFKWYAQRSEFVTWKDCPQDPRGILEWKRRINAVRELQSSIAAEELSLSTLRSFSQSEAVDYIVLLRSIPAPSMISEPVFRNGTFDVYRMHGFGGSQEPIREP
jgi:hypothetical protein